MSTHPNPRHVHHVAPLRVAVVGTRGLPAGPDGVEAAVEEIGRRLVANGHRVTVYGRVLAGGVPREHLGMRLVGLPALGSSPFGSLARTAAAAAHLSGGARQDVVLLLGTRNAPLIPLLRARSTAVAVQLRDDDTAGAGTASGRWLRLAQRRAALEADALIADTYGAAHLYEDAFGVPAEVIPTGAKVLRNAPTDALEAIGLVPGQFHLVVARIEPDNQVELLVQGYSSSRATLPLVVVGDSPPRDPSARRIAALAAGDRRVRLLGAQRDQRLLDQLYTHALTSLHGRSALGTDPSLVRAMGAGTAVLVRDTPANREVVGTAGYYFDSPQTLALQLDDAERYPFRFKDIGELLRERVRVSRDWDAVTEAYEALAAKLSRGYSTRGMSPGSRRLEALSPMEATVGLPRG